MIMIEALFGDLQFQFQLIVAFYAGTFFQDSVHSSEWSKAAKRDLAFCAW